MKVVCACVFAQGQESKRVRGLIRILKLIALVVWKTDG